MSRVLSAARHHTVRVAFFVAQHRTARRELWGRRVHLALAHAPGHEPRESMRDDAKDHHGEHRP
eukprot:3576933-Prymnesium_polylepis.1